MVVQTKWTERKFNFDIPIGIFPCIIERLRGTPGRAEELTRNLSREILTKRVNAKWSIQEQVGHLIETEKLHDGRIDDYLANLSVLRAADMSNRATVQADYNGQNIKDVLATLRTSRIHFIKRLEDVADEILARTAIHPRLNLPMRLVDMTLFVAEHDDHHLGSIAGLVRLF